MEGGDAEGSSEIDDLFEGVAVEEEQQHHQEEQEQEQPDESLYVREMPLTLFLP